VITVLAVRANDHMRDEDRERLNAWLASVGGNPKTTVAFAVIANGDGWDLHVTEKVQGEHGGDILDLALNDVVTRPRIIPLGAEKTWPDINVWKQQR
jgi:hypothetical protein